MPLLGKLLTLLPNLYYTGFIYGLFQLLFVFLFAVNISRWNKSHLWIALAALGSSVYLRGTACEYSNAWLSIHLNLLFGAIFFSYLTKPSPSKTAGMLACAVIAPTFYLLGLVDSATYLTLLAGAWYFKRPKHSIKTYILPFTLVGILTVWLLFVVWRPYFLAISNFHFTLPEHTSLTQKLKRAFGVVFFFPEWMGYYANPSFDPVLQTDPTQTSALTQFISSLAAFFLKIWNWFFLLNVLAYFISIKNKLIFSIRDGFHKRQIQNIFSSLSNQSRTTLILVFWICFMGCMNALAGNYRWHRGERIDQSIQIFPMLLLCLAFTHHIWSENLGVFRKVRAINYCFLFLFITTNLAVGYLAPNDQLAYHGNTIGLGEVPWAHKRAALEFMVSDFGRSNAKEKNCIPIHYSYTGMSPWAVELNSVLEKFYQPAPYRHGTEFDYELTRAFQLPNCNGVNSKYWVTYTYETPPIEIRNALITKDFGLLRVSVVN